MHENDNKKESKDKRSDSDWKNRIYEIRQSADASFNKLIVYLSSGALALTIGFVQEVVDLSTAICKIILIASWSLFTTSLLVILGSYLTTVKSMDLDLNGERDKSDQLDKKTSFLNYSAIFTLVFGIILFIIFISINL